MFGRYLHHSSLIVVLVVFAIASFADLYKWVDAKGQTHYGQQAPQDYDVELIKTPPPPAIDPDHAQKSVGALIAQQVDATKKKQAHLEKTKAAAKQEAVRKENCRIAQYNLQQYRNNPNRRVINADGSVTRLSEEERQGKIVECQQRIQDYCY